MSTTVLFHQLWVNPKAQELSRGGRPEDVRDDDVQEEFEDFLEEVWEEVAKYGEIDEILIADNVADHMVGNVYVKYFREEDAAECVKAMAGRVFAGRPVRAELTNATDMRDARCRQVGPGQRGYCRKGLHCNFVHPKFIPRDLMDLLEKEQPHAGENDRAPGAGGYNPGPRRDDRDRYRRRSRSRSPPARISRYRYGSRSRSRSRSARRSHSPHRSQRSAPRDHSPVRRSRSPSERR